MVACIGQGLAQLGGVGIEQTRAAKFPDDLLGDMGDVAGEFVHVDRLAGLEDEVSADSSLQRGEAPFHAIEPGRGPWQDLQ